MTNSKVCAIVLAAGKGTRMNSEIPKVLHPIGDKPMITHTINTLEKLNLGEILVVVGYKADEVKNKLGNKVKYVFQKELKGTGDAVMQALPQIPRDCQIVMVVNGDDSAFYKPETLNNLIKEHLKSRSNLTILTSYQESLDVPGRIFRDDAGKIIDIKPNFELTPEELETHREYVCGVYLFDRDFLEDKLPKTGVSKISGEHLITSLIFQNLGTDILQEIRLQDPNEWVSVNSIDELERAQKIWQKLNG